jgi:DNA-binding transcriptional LysR family regulator
MEIRQLQYFLAVADCLHFSRASQQVHLSQPALSLQIRALEKELGVRLLERNRQKTGLTAAGRVFRDQARELLAQASRVAERTVQAAQGKLGRIRLGFISTAAAHIVPPLVSRFRRSHPHVQLELRHTLTADQVAMLESNALDLGFFRLPIADPHEIETIPIHREPLSLFVPVTHALAHKKNLRLEDLEQSEFIVYARERAPGFHDFILRTLQDAGVTPAVTQEANDMYTLVSLVAAGLGVSIAPLSVQNYRISGVVVRRIAGLPPSEIALGFRKHDRHPAATAFIDLALKMYARPGRRGSN